MWELYMCEIIKYQRRHREERHLLFRSRVTLNLNNISKTELLFAIFLIICLHYDVYLKQINYCK